MSALTELHWKRGMNSFLPHHPAIRYGIEIYVTNGVDFVLMRVSDVHPFVTCENPELTPLLNDFGFELPPGNWRFMTAEEVKSALLEARDA